VHVCHRELAQRACARNLWIFKHVYIPPMLANSLVFSAVVNTCSCSHTHALKTNQCTCSTCIAFHLPFCISCRQALYTYALSSLSTASLILLTD